MRVTPLSMNVFDPDRIEAEDFTIDIDFGVRHDEKHEGERIKGGSEKVQAERKSTVQKARYDLNGSDGIIGGHKSTASGFSHERGDDSAFKHDFSYLYYGMNAVQNIFSPVIGTSCSPLEDFLREKNIPMKSISLLKKPFFMNSKKKETTKKTASVGALIMEMMQKDLEVRDCKTAKPNLLEMIDNDNPRDCSTAYPEKTPSLTPIGDDFSFLTRIFNEETRAESEEDFMNDIKVYLNRKHRACAVVDIETCTNIVKDQEGSRFIQKRLEMSNKEEWIWLVKNIRASELCVDLFGNYVIQKLIENKECGAYITECLEGSFKEMSLNPFGCRVVQKLLDVNTDSDIERHDKITKELKSNILELVYDSNGNHVVQKIVERKIDFQGVFYTNCIQLSNHKYGCRVLQKLFEKNECSRIIQKLIHNSLDLAENQYGNYVLQHIITLKRGYLDSVCDMLLPYIFSFSLHKFASNVIEKLIKMCDSKRLNLILDELTSNNQIVKMSMDKYANYVVQRILECDKSDRITSVLVAHINELKNCVYCKQIVVKLSKR